MRRIASPFAANQANLVEVMETKQELLDNLMSLNAINAMDYQSILAETIMNQKNARLIDVILRGSDQSFQYFCAALTLVKQAYVVDYITRGRPGVISSGFVVNF